MAVQRKVDVVTVGAGWTAGILAQQLTAAGYRVLSLEQGPARWATPDFAHNHDQLRYSIRNALMVNLSKETWTWRPNPRLPALPMRQYGSFHPGQGLGGAGVHWAAQVWRFYPNDFRYRSHHVERYGESKLPAGNRIQDWPVTYEELEPYYDRFEYDTGVSGLAGNLGGVRMEGGDPFEGPRSRPYPLPPLETTNSGRMFREAALEFGLHPFPQANSILSRNYKDMSGRTRSACIYCGFCVRFGCEVDAKTSALTAHIPLALATKRYEIRTGAKVLRVNLGADGLATGVTYVDAAGQEHVQPADVVVLSAYTLENVRLLLLSRSQTHPNGLGNDRGLVGKNYTYQLVKTPATGIFEGRRLNQFMGNSSLMQIVNDYNADNFDHSQLDFIGGASIQCGGGERDPLTSALDLPPLQEAEEEGEGGQAPTGPTTTGAVGSLTGAGGGKEWGRAWKENLRRNWDGVVGIGIQGESLPYEDQFLDLDPTYKDAWGQPLLRITYDFHDNDRRLYRFLTARCAEILERMGPTRTSLTEELDDYNIYEYQSTHNTGGAIMGRSPGDSVTNKYGQVWDTPNVFVTGAALYPQNPGSNPTETLCALAYMTAEALVERYFKDPNRVLV